MVVVRMSTHMFIRSSASFHVLILLKWQLVSDLFETPALHDGHRFLLWSLSFFPLVILSDARPEKNTCHILIQSGYPPVNSHSYANSRFRIGPSASNGNFQVRKLLNDWRIYVICQLVVVIPHLPGEGC